MWQKLNKSYPFRLELIPLGLLILTLYLAGSAYPVLPAIIPTHFNIKGIPDGWGSKNQIFIYPGFSAFVYLLCTFLNIWLAITRDPRQLISLPQTWKAVLTEAQTEELRLFLNRCLFALKVLILGLNTYSVYITIEVAWGRASNLGALFWLFLIAVLVLVGIMLWKSFSITHRARI